MTIVKVYLTGVGCVVTYVDVEDVSVDTELDVSFKTKDGEKIRVYGMPVQIIRK
jgi:hypothetical protein